MAIIAEYKHRDILIKNAYVKIIKIWGSNTEGWNALVGVSTSKETSEQKAYVSYFNVGPVSDFDTAYKSLYALIDEKFNKQSIKFKSDEITSIDVEEKPKKAVKKKVTKNA